MVDQFCTIPKITNYFSLKNRDPYYTKIGRDEAMSTLSFISTAAGLLGLCMGLSFVSMFEVIYHFFNFGFEKIRKTVC